MKRHLTGHHKIVAYKALSLKLFRDLINGDYEKYL